MANLQAEMTSLCLFPHRHLKSGTYQSLIQILSHCHDHSRVSTCKEPRLESCKGGEVVGPDCLVSEKERGGDEIQCFEAFGLDTLETCEDENDSLLQLEDLDLGFNQQLMLMDELEHIIQGNGELINDHDENVVVENLVNGKSENFDSSEGQSTVDHQISKPSGDTEDGSSLLRINSLELGHKMQQKAMTPEILARTDCTMGSHTCMAENVEVEEGEISGGFEVGDALVGILFDNNKISEEKKDDEKRVSKEMIDKRELPHNDQNRADETFSGCSSFGGNAVDYASVGIAMEPKDMVNDGIQLELENVVHGASIMATDAGRYDSVPAARGNKRKASKDEGDVGYLATNRKSPRMHGEISEQSPAGKQEIISEKKLDSSVCNKKKRSIVSKERKARKKQRERKKRAEKNRQLGVKRLKLRPVLKPKSVTFCRHYLMGRCQEGDTCKFSHDTIPLTKSKPCCHFARSSCMKGDQCPFDHQLSKYPCNNFLTKGFCNRGDDCMFSHKRPSKEDNPSSLSTSVNEPKPPSVLHISNPQKLQKIDQIYRQNVGGLFNIGKVSSGKTAEQNIAKTPLNPTALRPKGINCLFLGKSSVLESSKPEQCSSSPKMNEGCKVENPSKQSVLEIVPNMDEAPKRALPAIAPRGVNFLSFGKDPPEDSSSKKLASVLLNGENGVKPSLSNDFNSLERASSCCNVEESTKLGHQTTQSVSSTLEKSSDILKKTHPAFTPQALNDLSVRKGLIDDSISDKIASFSSGSDNGGNSSFHESQNTPDKQSAIRWTLPPPLPATGHSAGHLAQVQNKSTPNSSQKALMSTLAFASKIEKEMNINTFAVSGKANCQTSGNTIDGTAAGSSGGPLNDSGKASKILEFLCGIGKN